MSVDERLKRELMSGIVGRMPKDKTRNRLGLYVVVLIGVVFVAALLGNL
jgi:hypothetical protein